MADRESELSDALRSRLGWRVESDTEGSQPCRRWCFGLGGTWRLVITPTREDYIVYEADGDTERHCSTVAEVVTWLDEHEDGYNGASPLQDALLDSLNELQGRTPD